MRDYASVIIGTGGNLGNAPSGMLPAMAHTLQIVRASRKKPAAGKRENRRAGRPATNLAPPDYEQDLRLLREALDLTQRQVAAAAGIHPSVYGELERGRRRLNADHAAGLARVFKVPIGRIFTPEAPHQLPITIAIAAHQSESRPDSYDLHGLPAVYAPRWLAEPEECFVAEVFDDSANKEFAAHSQLMVRPFDTLPVTLALGAKIVVRFMLADGGQTFEVLYGRLDRTLSGDLMLLTRSHNPLVPVNPIIQRGSPRLHELDERVLQMIPQSTRVEYRPQSGDPGLILGVVVHSNRVET